MFVADEPTNRVRMVDESGGMETFMGMLTSRNDPSILITNPTQVISATRSDVRDASCPQSDVHWLVLADMCQLLRVEASTLISLVAGRADTCMWAGDAGPAIDARLAAPRSVAVVVESALQCVPRLWIADTDNHRIRYVNEFGEMSTIAGTGVASYSGNGSPALDAALNSPSGVAVSHYPNAMSVTIWIADTGNHKIRRIDPSGNIYDVAGTGAFGFNGDGAASSTELYSPHGLAVHPWYSGQTGSHLDILFADTGNHCIRKVALDNTVTTIAGMCTTSGSNGYRVQATEAELNTPIGIAAYPVVNGESQVILYIADSGNGLIRKIDASGYITHAVGRGYNSATPGNGGNPLLAGLYTPTSVDIASDATTLRITDSMNNMLRIVTTPTPTPTPSSTPSVLPSPTSSPSPSTSVPATTSPTPSVSVTSSATQSPSPSTTSTPSSTASGTASPSNTATQSATASPSTTVSVSSSPSSTTTPTGTASGTGSPSQTTTPSTTPSTTVSVSPSTTVSVSPSIS
ncbi:MAG: hypothetical protein EOO65_04380, partial [Methanosarcinales archaeon]